MNLPLPVDEASGMARERVGDDVAGLEERHDLLEDRVGIDAVRAGLRESPQLAEVDIERQVRALRDLRRLAQDLGSPAREPAALGGALEALDDVAGSQRP